MLKKTLFPLLFLMGSLAFGETVTYDFVSWTAQGSTRTNSTDISRFGQVSVQAVYEDSSPSADTVSDGVLANLTITIPDDITGLIGTAASATINFQDYTAVSGDSIIIAGRRFTEGTDFDAETSSTVSASNLAAVIAARHPDVTATSSVSTVTVTARSLGTSGNDISLLSTDDSNLVVSASALSGGIDAPSVTIYGVTLTEDTDFNIVTDSATSADNLADAIGNDSTLGAIFSTSTSVNVITLTEIDPSGSAYFASASTTGITISNWTYGISSDIDPDEDTISQTSHGFGQGLGLLFANVSGTDPGGLTDQTTYYVIKQGENAYQLASSKSNAVAGSAVDITGVTGGGSFTLTPITFSAAYNTGFYWQVSNDGSNWSDLTGTVVNGIAVTSVTYSADGTTVWDFGDMGYRFLRLNYTPPTFGGLDLTATVTGLVGTTAASANYFYVFNPDQAKLPDSNPCAISNSTNAVTSSLLCDASTDETVTWSTILYPFNDGTMVADIYYSMASATSGDVVTEVELMCVTDADSADLDSASFDSVNGSTTTVPGTAGYLDVVSTNLTNDDSCKEGDLITVRFGRNADHASDGASGDIEVRKVVIKER